MDQAADVRRWKLVAFASLALLIGYVAGQLSPSATAQQGVTKVQLDTSNCRTESVDPPMSPLPELLSVPDGSVVTAVYLTQDSGEVLPRFIYTVCR
jgi:hypothetical protein